MKKQGFRLVKITWDDSTQPISAWTRTGDFEPETPCACVSVGWLVHDGDHYKVLAPNRANVGEGESEQMSGMIHITVCSIKSIVDLK